MKKNRRWFLGALGGLSLGALAMRLFGMPKSEEAVCACGRIHSPQQAIADLHDVRVSKDEKPDKAFLLKTLKRGLMQ